MKKEFNAKEEVKNIVKFVREYYEKNNENDLVIDYDYKFNIVTDDDIKKPDITGYIIKE